jgi:undecaprenyl-diphosphatase
MGLILTAILLGIVEGLTEFIPVSSTGHLILASELFGYNASDWEVFNVVIQLGAILAVVVQYWRTFWDEGMRLLRLDPEGLRFVRNLLAGFLPSAVLGFILRGTIYDLLESPTVVAWALIAGGVAILAVERVVTPGEDTKVADLPLRQALGVGVAQCLALVPGVSRSGATIMGALALGVGRRTAAEFSFFLAIPTMLGATVLSLADKRDELASGAGVGWTEVAIGFAVAFVVALVVIRMFVAYVSRRGFAPFAWYRIAVGAAAVAWLAMR